MSEKSGFLGQILHSRGIFAEAMVAEVDAAEGVVLCCV